MSRRLTITLPASFQTYTDGQRSFHLVASSVREAVEALAQEAPKLRSHLLDDSGQVRPYINLFVDNQQMVDIDREGLEIRDGAELLIVSAVAGG